MADGRASTSRPAIRIQPRQRISHADLKPSFLDEYHAIMRELALDHQWALLVELTGSEECAAMVVERTPFMGVPSQAREIIERRDRPGHSEDTTSEESQ